MRFLVFAALALGASGCSIHIASGPASPTWAPQPAPAVVVNAPRHERARPAPRERVASVPHERPTTVVTPHVTPPRPVQTKPRPSPRPEVASRTPVRLTRPSERNPLPGRGVEVEVKRPRAAQELRRADGPQTRPDSTRVAKAQ